MHARLEGAITAAMCMLVGTLGVWQVWPRLVASPERPDFVAPPIRVAIEGEVRAPGMYEMPFGATRGDLVDRAGGLLAGAETTLVNRADPLTHGELVIVPGRFTTAGDVRVPINTASVDELTRLPGIGPVTARRVVEGRPYAAIDDLLAVRGIGPKTLERLRPLVRP